MGRIVSSAEHSQPHQRWLSPPPGSAPPPRTAHGQPPMRDRASSQGALGLDTTHLPFPNPSTEITGLTVGTSSWLMGLCGEAPRSAGLLGWLFWGAGRDLEWRHDFSPPPTWKQIRSRKRGRLLSTFPTSTKEADTCTLHRSDEGAGDQGAFPGSVVGLLTVAGSSGLSVSTCLVHTGTPHRVRRVWGKP